ncbi:glycine zipper 2TM domain-containing protein, partial [bacterium]|nr:glycine zipper 2TM domain-containing protein [bacterium]
AQPAAPTICRDCGVIEAVNAIEQPGEANGMGAVIGGLLGGVVGNQISTGSGRTAARILGMAGGAYAGHQVEKAQRKTTKYELIVRFEDGTTRRFDYDSQPAWQTGERVKLVNGVLVSNA